MTDFLKDYPCKICIVQAICSKTCREEQIWYIKLSTEEKHKYVKSELFTKRLKQKFLWIQKYE
ncbi:MAG: hypothetical protein ACFFG0_00365 [Candidatus Thorarchaeota archaeon]